MYTDIDKLFKSEKLAWAKRRKVKTREIGFFRVLKDIYKYIIVQIIQLMIMLFLLKTISNLNLYKKNMNFEYH